MQALIKSRTLSAFSHQSWFCRLTANHGIQGETSTPLSGYWAQYPTTMSVHYINDSIPLMNEFQLKKKKNKIYCNQHLNTRKLMATLELHYHIVSTYPSEHDVFEVFHILDSPVGVHVFGPLLGRQGGTPLHLRPWGKLGL